MKLVSLRATLLASLVAVLSACGGDNSPASDAGKDAADARETGTTDASDAPGVVDVPAEARPDATGEVKPEVAPEAKPEAASDGSVDAEVKADVQSDADASADTEAGADAFNPCAADAGGCAPEATCTPTSGVAACACKTGYAGDGKTCTPVNNCLASNGGCDANATCTMTGPGTNLCTCAAGYHGDGKTCYPIDNCMANHGTCDAHAECEMLGPGTSTCICDNGYNGNGKTCAPVNNCLFFNGSCDLHATCAMTGPGTSSCTCQTGYSGDGTTCAPVNNCLTSNSGCDAHATCTMTGPGTNSCACPAHYDGNGTTCTPVNNCLINHGDCDAHATCAMTGPGTNSCTCNAHYDGDGTTCIPVNSCLTSNGGCDANAACLMTGPGTNSCACNAHYDGDGTTCTPVNNCLTSNGGCGAHATCLMTGPGTSTCPCDNGYVDDGTACALSACSVSHGGCDPHATCTLEVANTDSCRCDDGYLGNGQACEATPTTPSVTFMRAHSYVGKTIGTVDISVLHTRVGAAVSIPYTLTGNAKGSNSDGHIDLTTDYDWFVLTLAIDPAVHAGDTIVVTLGTPVSTDPVSMGTTVHTVTIVDDHCSNHYPRLVVTSDADVDSDGIPDGCDVSLAPAGQVSTYLKPASAAASTEAGGSNLLARNTITAQPDGLPPASSFIFQHDWSKDYAVAGALLSNSGRLPQWFEATFPSAVTANELRLINFNNFRGHEWMRGIKTFNVYGSNSNAAAPVEGGAPRPDMHLLGTLEASSHWERTWPNPTRGLPEVLRLSSPGAYKYYFLETLASHRPDQTLGYPGDLTGFEKIEFATYGEDPCLTANGGCDAMATCHSTQLGAVQCKCPSDTHLRAAVCVPGAYDPQTVTGLATWLQADALTTASDGQGIASWPDSTSNANDATQIGGMHAPTFSANAINGMPALHFDGGASMSLPSAALASGNDPYTVIVVAVVSNTDRNGLVCGGVPGGNTANCFRTLDGGEGAYGLVDYWWANDLYTPAGAFSAGQAFIGMTRYTNGDRRILVDGTQRSQDAAQGNNVVPGHVVIGTTVVDETLDGDIAEVLIYNAALSDGDREYVECYLADKYGITLGHACL